MAKSGQTFRKRQREMKLREKAQLKRERRLQRREEKKRVQDFVAPHSPAIQSDLQDVSSPEGEDIGSTERESVE